MTSIRFVQLQCEVCITVTYPAQPAAERTARDVRADAAHAGWEVLRGTKGRDVCPPCRVHEIETAAGTLPLAARPPERPSP